MTTRPYHDQLSTLLHFLWMDRMELNYSGIAPWIRWAYSAPWLLPPPAVSSFGGPGSFSDDMPLGISGTSTSCLLQRAQIMHAPSHDGVTGVLAAYFPPARSLITIHCAIHRKNDPSTTYNFDQKKTYKLVPPRYLPSSSQYASFNNSPSCTSCCPWPVVHLAGPAVQLLVQPQRPNFNHSVLITKRGTTHGHCPTVLASRRARSRNVHNFRLSGHQAPAPRWP